MKCVLPILLLINSVAVAQKPDTSFRLLWFKGKKINDSTLITPTGTRISYSPKTGKLQSKFVAGKDPFETTAKELKRNNARKDEVNKLIMQHPRKNGMLPMAPIVNRAFDRVEDRLADAAIPEIEIFSDVQENTTGTTKTAPGGLPPWLEDDYADVKRFVDQIRQHTGQFNLTPPPDKDLDYCFPCDEARQQSYKDATEKFMKDFLYDEYVHIGKCGDILNYFVSQRGNPQFDTVQALAIENELFSSISDILGFIERKMLALWDTYKHDAKKIPFMYEYLVRVLRNNVLLGRMESNNVQQFHRIGMEGVETAMAYLNKARDELDFTVLLNLDWMVDLFRTAEALGIVDMLVLKTGLLDYLNNNYFKLTVDAHAVMENENTHLEAQMYGVDFLVAIPDENCQLHWNLVQPGKVIFELRKPQMRVNDKNPAYIGTREWVTSAPTLKLDFCNAENRDTALFYNFHPTKGTEKWDLPNTASYPMQTIRSVFLMSFMDKERMKAMAKNPEFQREMQQKMMEKQQEFLKAQQKMKTPGAMTSEQLAQMNNMMNASQDILSTLETPLLSFLLKDRLVNFRKVVFDHTLDGRNLMPDNEFIKHALFKVKIEHSKN